MLEARVRTLTALVAKETQRADWNGQDMRKTAELLSLAKMQLKAALDEVKNLEAKLSKVTEPAWKYARLDMEPAQHASTADVLRLWTITGRCGIAINVEFLHVRTRPRGDMQAYLSLLVDDFTKMARKHAIENLRVLLD